VYTTGDTIGAMVDKRAGVVHWFKNGKFVAECSLPGLAAEGVQIIASFCNDYHQLSILKRNSAEARKFWADVQRNKEK